MSNGEVDLVFNVSTEHLAQIICQKNSYGDVSGLVQKIVEEMGEEKISWLTIVKILEGLVSHYTEEVEYYRKEEFIETFEHGGSGSRAAAASDLMQESQAHLQATRTVLELARTVLAGRPQDVIGPAVIT